MVNDTKPTTTYSNDTENLGTGGLAMGVLGLTYAGFPVSYTTDNKADLNYSLGLLSASSQYLSVSDNSNLSIVGDLTIELWYKPSSQPTAGTDNILVSKFATTGNQRSYYFSYSATSGGSLRLKFACDATGAGETTKERSNAMITGTWYHCACVYIASAGTVQFYLNTNPSTINSALPTSIFNSTADFQISGYEGTTSLADGFFDEVRIWNTARTSAQISANYNVRLRGNETGLIGYWKWKGTNDFNDSTPNGNNLTSHGSPSFSESVPFGTFYTESTKPS